METVTISGRAGASPAGGCFLAELPHDPGHVVADGLGQAGGGHPDEPGAVFVHDVAQALLEVGAAAVDRLLFPQGGGGDVHGLPVMADDVAAHVSGAALGAVEERHRPLDAPEGQAGPQRLAELAGVGGGNVCGFELFIALPS